MSNLKNDTLKMTGKHLNNDNQIAKTNIDILTQDRKNK